MSTSLSSIRIVPAAGASPCGIGKYRYIALIAEGGMALVYLAVTKTSASFEKLVVIKQLREELAEDPTFVTMFEDEARLAARLNHPNVVQTLEVGSEDGRHFIAMEFLEGVPYTRLARIRERIPPPLAFHVRILCDLLEGLHYAHELRDFDGQPLNVVHRDVSPQNVMLTFAGGVKVLDFGIAKANLADEQRPDDFKGKLEYMAPEQARLEEVDRRADIFSVGIMLWEAIARRRMYVKGEDKLARLLAGDHPDVLTVRPDAPRRLVKICTRALALDPDGRYANALEMSQEMEEWLEGTTQHVATRDLGRYTAEKFASTRAKLADAIEAQLRLFRDLPEDSRDPIELSRIPIAEIPMAELSEPPPSMMPSEAPPGHMPSGAPPASLSAPPHAPSAPSDAHTGMSAPSAWSSTPSLSGPPPPGHYLPAPSAPRSRAPVAIMACTGILLTVAVVGGALFMRSRAQRRADSGVTATVSASASATVSAPVPAASIDFTVRAAPPSSRISIDGRAQPGNPATGHLLSDASQHVIRVEADGFEAKEEKLTFERSFFITLELKPVPPPERTSTPTGRGGPSGPRGTRRGPGIDTDNPYK